MTGIPDPDRTVRIVVDGHPLRVSCRPGSLDRVPLLLLMGIAGRLELWDPLRAELARRDGPPTTAFDVPGVGGSPTPRFPLRLAGVADLTVALLDRLDVARADVLGMSWGGLLAQELAVAAPTRVRRLVLANTNLGTGSIPPCPRPWRRHPRNLERPATGSPPWPRSALWSRGTLYQYLGLTGWTSWTRLHRLRHPTLVIASNSDRLVPSSNARLLSTLIRNARFLPVDGASHLLLVREPHRVAAAICSHLSSSGVELSQ